MSRNQESEVEGFVAFKETVKSEAEERLVELFPRKVLELDELLKQCSSLDLSSTQSELGLRGGEAANSLVLTEFCPPCNAQIVAFIDKLKPELVFVLEQLNMLKMWIQLNIPKIQDGNNFGATIQSETVQELVRIEGDVSALYETIPQYFTTRAKLISRSRKYPQVEDIRQAILQFDVKEVETLTMTCSEVRNIYCCLHDMVLKNLEKLKKPRTGAPNMMMY